VLLRHVSPGGSPETGALVTTSDPPGADSRDEPPLENVLDDVGEAIREGRFGRSLALLASGASAISGLEVAYEHYTGSYSNRIMYTPVILSAGLAGAGVWGACDRRAATTVLRGMSAITLIDSCVGFFFHVRGIARKPGGWRLPITNIVMGPPIFSPLLFGISAYLGLIASFLRRENERPADPADDRAALDTGFAKWLPPATGRNLVSFEQDVREGRFQTHLLIATAVTAGLSGFEAWYSHYKNAFTYWVQWTPVAIAPVLAGVSLAALADKRLARTLVPTVSAIAGIDAGVGVFYHARGIVRRPGGPKHLPYNIMYGPPIFAPMLFGASAMFGILASLLRRST